MSLTAEQRALVMHMVGEQVSGKGSDSMTRAQLAAVLGRHDNTLANWQKMPEVQEAVKRGIRDMENSRDYFKLVMRRRALEEMWSNYSKATESSEKRQYLKMVLEETKDADTDETAVDLTSKTDEELCDLMLAHDISPVGMTKDELVRLAHSEGGA